MKTSTIQRKKQLRAFVGTTLASASLFQLAMPVLAQVAAGTNISNTATATYKTPSGDTLSTQSNTVVLTVAEVAGITLTANGAENLSNPGGQYQAAEQVNFKFLLTNSGNDPSQFTIPKPQVLNGDTTRVQNFTVSQITYVVLNADGSVNTARTPVPVDIGALAGTSDGAQTLSLSSNEQIRINVIGNISSSVTTGDNVKVILGNTTGNANDADSNPNTGQSRVGNTSANDVYTRDNADNSGVVGEIAGAPINGIQEAQAQQTVAVAQNILQPFVKLSKTNSNYQNQNTSALTDDTLTYNLSLTVADQIPAGVATSATGADDLYPTWVKGKGGGSLTSGKHVLISDVLPKFTKLNAVPTAPADWTVVYSTTPTTGAGSGTGYKADWDTTAPTNLEDVTQIGFIYTANTPVPKSAIATPYQTFSYTVKLITGYTYGDKIANIAQVFGETGDVTPPTGPVDPSVYDESGDESYNNDSNNDGAPDILVTDANGVADPANHGTDDNNNNTGTGLGGEDNIFDIPFPTGNVLNGTVNETGKQFPTAEGPIGSNDDFTNKSASLANGQVGLVSFNNSLSFADTATTGNQTADITLALGDLSDLPAGQTIITLQYDNGITTKSVTYQVNKATAASTPVVTLIGSDGIPATINPARIIVPVTEGSPVNYAVTVDLPDNAPLLDGYDVPVIAFIDTNNNGIPDTGENDRNTTIDRVYTGYVRLTKAQRVLQSDGTTPARPANGSFTTDSLQIQEGEVVQYKVTYENITELQGDGTTDTSPGDSEATKNKQNILLPARQFTLIENGVTVNNNWAADLDGDAFMDTVHFNFTPVHSTTSIYDDAPVTRYFTDATADNRTGGTETDPNAKAAFEKYTLVFDPTGTNLDANSLRPQSTGTFEFKRQFKGTTP